MKTLWSNLCGHYSAPPVLGALVAAGMDWSGENVGALRGGAAAGSARAAAVANVRSADIVSTAPVAIFLRREGNVAAIGVNCHGTHAVDDQVLVLGTRGGGGSAQPGGYGPRYIAQETKFLHCHGPVWNAKKRKGARA